MKSKNLCIVLMLLFVLCSCTGEELKQENARVSESIQEEQMSCNVLEEVESELINRDDTMIAEDDFNYELETLLPENPIGEMYYWVFFQNGRKLPDQKEVQKANDRLHEIGLDSSIGFHIITIKEYITPEVLTQVYKDLDGQMDFVSISPALCGFYMYEWKENFVELSGILREGELNQFYKTVPEIVWDANQIDGGIYSFSNSTYVYVHGYWFSEESTNEYGRDMLLSLQNANGVEDVEVWEKLSEEIDGAIGSWSGLNFGKPVATAENPYGRSIFSALTNAYERKYFVELTDDIRFDIETEEFEWLVESEKYIELWVRVKEFYEKGYIGSSRNDVVNGQYASGNTVTIQRMKSVFGDEIGGIWVPSWKKSRICDNPTQGVYMYSCVYKEAKDGWEEVLNLIGSNESIEGIFDEKISLLMSEVVYHNQHVALVPDINSSYEMIEFIYEEAEADPLNGFVFNPYPIRFEWEEYNELMSMYGGVSLTLEDGTPNFEIMDTILETYQSRKEDAHIDLVLAEINRQYTEWKNSQTE